MNDPAILQGKKVLVVEDNQLNVIIAKRCLESFGMLYSVATDGKAALELFEKESFDLIMLDLNIPLIDGWKIASIIRASGNSKCNTPIVVVSASEEYGFENKIKASKINASVYKPYTPEHLKNVLIANLVPVSLSI